MSTWYVSSSVLDVLRVSRRLCTQLTMILVRAKERTVRAMGQDNGNALNVRVEWGHVG